MSGRYHHGGSLIDWVVSERMHDANGVEQAYTKNFVEFR